MNEIPFRFRSGLMYVSITIVHQGKKLTLDNCIFDTGSGGTVFDTDEVFQLGIKVMPESPLKRLKTVGGYQTVFVSKIDRLIFGKKSLSNIFIEVGNLHSKFGIQGIIGTDTIRNFDWEMQFSNSTLRTHNFPQ